MAGDRVTSFHAGYGVITGPGGQKEFDTQTCAHCGRVWVVRSSEGRGDDPGGWCGVCAAMICPTCVGKPCFPLERRIQAIEDRDRFCRQLGI